MTGDNSKCRSAALVAPSASNSSTSIALLPPAWSYAQSCLSSWRYSPDERRSILEAIQRLRASCYLLDGAIKPSRVDNGKHLSILDDDGFHIFVIDTEGDVSGCIRLNMFHAAAYPRLPSSSHVWEVISRMPDAARAAHENAMIDLIAPLPHDGVVAEIGGWAVGAKLRGSASAKMLALSLYALKQLLGCGLSFFSATERNGSNLILQRLGASTLKNGDEALPMVIDEVYNCKMQILWATPTPPPRYARTVEQLRSLLCSHQIGQDSVQKSKRITDFRLPIRMGSLLDYLVAGHAVRL